MYEITQRCWVSLRIAHIRSHFLSPVLVLFVGATAKVCCKLFCLSFMSHTSLHVYFCVCHVCDAFFEHISTKFTYFCLCVASKEDAYIKRHFYYKRLAVCSLEMLIIAFINSVNRCSLTLLTVVNFSICLFTNHHSDIILSCTDVTQFAYL